MDEEYTPLDLDDDGKIDTYGVDADHDGYFEKMISPVDWDRSGTPEVTKIFIDTDLNGTYETKIVIDDYNEDGKPDRAPRFYADTNGDGTMETRGHFVDSDGDGIYDTIEPGL